MKILQIIYSLSSGGAERLVVDLSNHLAEYPENDVTLLLISGMDNHSAVFYLPDLNKKVKVLNLGKNGLSVSVLIGVYKVIRQVRPDVVHLHSNMVLIYLPVLLGVKTKFIHTLHNLADKCLAWKWCKPLHRWLYSNKVHAVTISNECHESFTALYGKISDTLIINGRDEIETTAALPSTKQELSNILKPEAPVFVNVARCHPAKNHSMLFEVFERLTKEGSDCQLLVLGSHHEANAEQYRNHPNIHIIGERRNVADYLACSDFFILSSVYEGLPLTLLEAMSMGCIPVCTPAGGIINVIRNGENGFIAKGFESEDLYKSVKEALDKSGSVNRDDIITEYQNSYSMASCARKYYDAYKRLFQ